VAAALALVEVNMLRISHLKLAEICAEAEHFVGTAGGGMDQTASLMGKKDSFLKIEFNPLKVQTISAPKNITLILFHSLIEAKKSQSARTAYNRRVLECQMGVKMFNQYYSQHFDQSFKPIQFIGEIKERYFNISDDQLNSRISKFVDQLNESYQLEELLNVFELSRDELIEEYEHILRGDRLSEPVDGYKIKGRFRHVYSECRRVERMIESMQSADIREMGQLLTDSHNSLSKDYEVSTPEVDSMVNKLKSLGVPGVRLMGAGFGGMILALSRAEQRDEVIDHMKDEFYIKEPIDKINDYIIPCNPSDGAGII
jgi:N-acetylgalactosamine kinase